MSALLAQTAFSAVFLAADLDAAKAAAPAVIYNLDAQPRRFLPLKRAQTALGLSDKHMRHWDHDDGAAAAAKRKGRT